MANIAELVVKLIADTTGFNGQMEAAAAQVKTSQAAIAESITAATTASRGYSDATLDLIAAQNAAMSGARAYMEAQDEAAAATVRSTVATEANTAAMAMNSRTSYSAAALISDVMTGQFSRSRREVAALANETGIMGRALQFAISPAGLLVGAVGLLGAATISAERDFDKFSQAVQTSNGYMGTTAGELQAMAQRIGNLTDDYDDAKEAVTKLAASGQFAGQQLNQAATIAAEFANITGEKVSEVANLMVEMATNPQKALDQLVDKYHRVTPAQAQVIQDLIKEGETAQATSAMMKAMGVSVSASFDEQRQHAGALDRMLGTLGHDFGEVWRGIGESIQIATGGGDAAQRLTALQHQLQDMRVSGETTGGYKEAYERIEQEAAALQKVVDKTHEATAAARKASDAWRAANPAAGTFAAFQKEGFGGVDLTGNLTKQLEEMEAALKVSYGDRDNFESEYWGTILQKAKAGSAAYVQAWEQVQAVQQRIDGRQLQESEQAEHKRETLAKQGAAAAKREHDKEAQAAMDALAEKRAAAQKNSTDLIAIDQEMVAEAVKLYGKESSQYHDTRMQMIRDEKALADAQRQAAEAKLQDSYLGQTSGLAQQLQDAQEAYRLGEISAEQLLQTVRDVDAQKAAADRAYYVGLEQLDAGSATKVAQDQKNLTAQLARDRKQDKADVSKTLGDIEREYEATYRRIGNTVMQSINGMIFDHETFRQAVLNIGNEILQTEEQNLVTTVAHHLAAEQAKTLATSTGTAERVALNVAADAKALASQAATAIKWITTEAAKAAAGAFSAMASIPYVGPFLAVGAAAAIGAEVIHLIGNVASAQGGWERVPADGMLTELHRDEMVLPANVADPVRNMARNGGNGGGTIIIQANDAASFQEMARRNRGALAGVMREAYRRGHFG